MSPDAFAELPLMLLRMGIAFVLGLPAGWEREHRHFSPGLRTFPLVSLGSCTFLLVAQFAYGDGDSKDAEARALQGLLSGIGFIGAGAILKGTAHVHGIATAVAIWITAAVGVAVAYGLYAVALVLAISTLITLQLFGKTPARVRKALVEERKEEAKAAER